MMRRLTDPFPGRRFNGGFGSFAARGIVASGGGSDVTAPTLVSATVAADGYSIALLYDETLDGSVPAAGDYALGGTNATIDSVGISGDTVTLTLDAAGLPVTGIQTVTLDYTAGANPVQDSAGNDAANLMDEATTNDSTVAAPLGVANTLLLGVNADNVTTSSGRITSALDIGDEGNDLDEETGSGPTLISGWRNGHDAFQGETDKYLLRSTLTGGTVTGNTTRYLVLETPASHSSNSFIASTNSTSAERHARTNSDGSVGLVSGTNANTTATLPTSTPTILRIVFSGSGGSIRAEPDGASTINESASHTLEDMVGAVWGGYRDGSLNNLGKHACWYDFEGTLSSMDNTDMLKWLRQEYDIVHA